MTKMGNTSLDIKALSEPLLQQQLHHRPVCTFQSIPTGERWSDAPRGGGGGKWQKIGDAELTVKHNRGTVVVLWKCWAHYSVRHRGTSLLSLPVPNFAANYERPHATPVRGDARIFGSDGFRAGTTLRRHIKLEYCNRGGVMRHKHQWSKTPVFLDCNVPHILCIQWLNSKYPKKMRYGMIQLQSSTDINVCKTIHYATHRPTTINPTIKLDKTTKEHNNAT